jgi:GNAT superfamily N-acetyltransferase
MNTAMNTEPKIHAREMENRDIARVCELQNAHYLHHFDQTPQSLERSHTTQQAQHGPQYGRLVWLEGGEIVAGMVFYPTPVQSHSLRFQMYGAGAYFSQLYLEFLARVAQLQPKTLHSVTREDMSDMAFLDAAGFHNRYQSWGAHLELNVFDFARFIPLEQKLFMQGYELETLEPNGPETLWNTLFNLYLETHPDTPYNPTTTPSFKTLPEFRSSVAQGFAYLAKFQEKIVGYVLFSQNIASLEVESEHTAVLPNHRGKGLGTLLCARGLAQAQAKGCTEAGTGGNVLNLPMLRVNQKLGYHVEPMWCTWWLELG